MEDREQLSEAMERLEKNIDKEVMKLKYYMEPADELIGNNDYMEMEIAVKQGTQVIDKITDLISQLEGMNEQIMHLGVANTMAHVRNEWWIPKLRA